MWVLRHQGGSQALAGIDQRVDENDLLQDWECVQRAPGIVGAAEEDHGRDDHAEHQSYVLLIIVQPSASPPAAENTATSTMMEANSIGTSL